MRRYYVRLKCVIKIFFFFFYFYYPIDKINNQNLSCLWFFFINEKI